jgi:hypothetical protein
VTCAKKETKKMKKLIVAAAAIALAVASQAAVVDWGYKITGDKTVDSVAAAQASAYANNYMVYLFAADAEADWDKLTEADLASAKDSSSLQYLSYGSRTGGNYATADKGGVVDAVRTVDVGDAASYVAKIVVVDTVNNTYVATSKTLTSRDETAGASQADMVSLTQATFAAQSFSGFAPVPEPTSGLLMLLGVAGLALRRRRA